MFYDRVPDLGEIVAVVSPASQGEHTAVTETVGERAQLAGRAPVHARREAQVGDRIALETVGAALQDDEVRCELLPVRRDVRPDAGEHHVVGTGGQRYVELGAARRAAASLLECSGAGIQV